MTDLSWLDRQTSAHWFGAANFHEPVRLRHLPEARLLWLNQQAAIADPQFCGDLAEYERHLLRSCAYVLAEDGDTAPGAALITGYADRYGGAGIGNNGGSGRAAVVNGYLVKGVGRTRLVSGLTAPSHASGGAYLEESVRETIFSEIVRAEFPHSAVPVLAILDTGAVQVWKHALGTTVERRTLVLRPCFVRPAHFVRATAFISNDPREGHRDAQRVQAMFAHAAASLGETQLAQAYEQLWCNWARQLAYGFVHRLSHASNTVSNICFDGKLLDFGAMSALPSWANCALMMSRQPFESQAQLLTGLISATGYFFGRHLAPRYSAPAEQARLATLAHAAYRQAIMVECLRLCGVRQHDAERAANGADQETIWRTLHALIRHYQRELIDMVECTPPNHLPWDIDKIWAPEAPAHLHALRSLVRSLIPEARWHSAARHCALMSTTRRTLFREDAKPLIRAAIDPSHRNSAPARAAIEQFISEQVATARRDHRLPISDAEVIGFAVSHQASYVLFREDGTGAEVAVAEPHARACAPKLPVRHLLKSCSAGELVFADPALPVFSGHVHVHARRPAARPLPQAHQREVVSTTP